MIKKTFKIVGMHCTSCGLLIESELEDIGVTAKASYAKGEVEVEYDPDKANESGIKEAVKKAGYEIA